MLRRMRPGRRSRVDMCFRALGKLHCNRQPCGSRSHRRFRSNKLRNYRDRAKDRSLGHRIAHPDRCSRLRSRRRSYRRANSSPRGRGCCHRKRRLLGTFRGLPRILLRGRRCTRMRFRSMPRPAVRTDRVRRSCQCPGRCRNRSSSCPGSRRSSFHRDNSKRRPPKACSRSCGMVAPARRRIHRTARIGVR